MTAVSVGQKMAGGHTRHYTRRTFISIAPFGCRTIIGSISTASALASPKSYLRMKTARMSSICIIAMLD